MKRKILIVILLGVLILSSFSFSESLITNEVKYGKLIKSGRNSDYPGGIKIEGPYVYEDGDDFIFTLVYSNGELLQIKDGSRVVVKTSFFNPPSGDIIGINTWDDINQIISDYNTIQYIVPKEKLITCNLITVFLYDKIYGDDGEKNISVYFHIDLNNVPQKTDLKKGYNHNSEKVTIETLEYPSEWAYKEVLELKNSVDLRESTFSNYKEGITRSQFVYLMVELYEELTGENVEVDNSIVFEDTEDPYANKAEQLKITNGIGNNKFGPDLIIDREQMATFLIRTLKVANLDLDEKLENTEVFSDDSEISSWAKNSIYLSRKNGILNGLGANKYGPKGVTTNEQTLYMVRNILKKYGESKIYTEIDKDRYYVMLEGELFKANFKENILFKENEICFKSFEDLDWFLKLSKSSVSDLEYTLEKNPNVKGILNIESSDDLSIKISNIYHGVDKIGEKTYITIESSLSNEKFEANIKELYDSVESTYDGFNRVNYYDINNDFKKMYVLQVEEIVSTLGIDYNVNYSQEFDIYILEFINNL